MRKQVKISEAEVNKKIWSYLLDLLFIVVTTIALYFASFYGIVKTCTNYDENQALIQDRKDTYSLNYDKKQEYTVYENAVKEFYFVNFTDELLQHFEDLDGSTVLSIEHIYNYVVLALPMHPTPENFENDLFKYKMNGDEYLVNEIAEIKPIENKTQKAMLQSHFWNAYHKLDAFLTIFDKPYEVAQKQNILALNITRVSTMFISVLIFSLIIPLTNRNNQTLGDRIFGLARINSLDGFLVPKYKLILKTLILFLIPLVGVFLGGIYFIGILAFGYFALNLFFLLFSKDNKDIADKICRMEQCFANESYLFKNEKEEAEFIKSDEFKKINEPSFLTKLSDIKPIDLSESRSETITKKDDK